VVVGYGSCKDKGHKQYADAIQGHAGNVPAVVKMYVTHCW
jgi:hypothetical protein